MKFELPTKIEGELQKELRSIPKETPKFIPTGIHESFSRRIPTAGNLYNKVLIITKIIQGEFPEKFQFKFLPGETLEEFPDECKKGTPRETQRGFPRGCISGQSSEKIPEKFSKKKSRGNSQRNSNISQKKHQQEFEKKNKLGRNPLMNRGNNFRRIQIRILGGILKHLQRICQRNLPKNLRTILQKKSQENSHMHSRRSSYRCPWRNPLINSRMHLVEKF